MIRNVTEGLVVGVALGLFCGAFGLAVTGAYRLAAILALLCFASTIVAILTVRSYER